MSSPSRSRSPSRRGGGASATSSLAVEHVRVSSSSSSSSSVLPSPCPRDATRYAYFSMITFVVWFVAIFVQVRSAQIDLYNLGVVPAVLLTLVSFVPQLLYACVPAVRPRHFLLLTAAVGAFFTARLLEYLASPRFVADPERPLFSLLAEMCAGWGAAGVWLDVVSIGSVAAAHVIVEEHRRATPLSARKLAAVAGSFVLPHVVYPLWLATTLPSAREAYSGGGASPAALDARATRSLGSAPMHVFTWVAAVTWAIWAPTAYLTYVQGDGRWTGEAFRAAGVNTTEPSTYNLVVVAVCYFGLAPAYLFAFVDARAARATPPSSLFDWTPTELALTVVARFWASIVGFVAVGPALGFALALNWLDVAELLA